MRQIIDYLSFSIPVTVAEDNDHAGWFYQVQQELLAYEELAPLWVGQGDPVPAKPMKPYNRAFAMSERGITVHANATLPHVTVQISGAGCDILRTWGNLNDLLMSVRGNLSRIDFASDIAINISPAEFMAQSHAPRIKTKGFINSPTGQTVTRGSRQSEKYLRVYMYNEPHPRAGILRVEFELKGATARAAAEMYLCTSINDITANLGNTFGICHPYWQPEEQQAVELRPATPERRGTPKLTWLNKQVAPTIKRLHDEGAFDARAWVSEILGD